ncbi:YunG family protein [Baia soyae]|uniref:Uncharacterized protein n=1 Tax=Baia soyae TaxID=1544746 RepID=A0A4R2RP14_9BACL|nr:hypothetical protein [Baia soyae]TCP65800.1 hypothetical protein EDD57_13039 [Baia soyae]
MKTDSPPYYVTRNILLHVWSKESSTKFTPENPALGQCGVTALVIHDLYGGEILKTRVTGEWHFYNKLSDQIYDFTASQFDQEISYHHIPSSREEAFADINEKQYEYLIHAVKSRLAPQPDFLLR